MNVTNPASKFNSPRSLPTVTRLENGLTIVHHLTPATSIVAVDVWIKAGAIVEPDAWMGTAHFLEHMIFKGTERLAPGMFDAAIETCGGVTNAATSYDYVRYSITIASQHLEFTLPDLAELLLHAAIPDAEFDRERDVVLEELHQSFDNPDWIAFQTLSETIYQRHAYGRSILGTEETLRARSPSEMRQFHQTHYQPENMTVVLVGDLEVDRAIDLVQQIFQPFPAPMACPIATPEAEPPMTEVRRQELYLPRLEQARLMLGWIVPGVDSPLRSMDQQLQAAYGMDVMAVLLAEGRTSRLVRELREERHLVQAIDSSFSLQKESGLFTISAWLDPCHLDQVEAIICDRLSELAAVPISEAELARCQRLLCNDHAFSTETPTQLAELYGYYSTIVHPDIATTIATDYIECVCSLQQDDLQHLANRYLSPYCYAATIVRGG